MLVRKPPIPSWEMLGGRGLQDRCTYGILLLARVNLHHLLRSFRASATRRGTQLPL